jgi:hypothetical protein
MPQEVPTATWDGIYQLLLQRSLDITRGVRPFIGLSADVDEADAAFLAEQGYLLDRSDLASQCGLYFDHARLQLLNGRMALLESIDCSDAPLVRFGRWPDGCKSALSFTGDLDALSLFDYAARLF